MPALWATKAVPQIMAVSKSRSRFFNSVGFMDAHSLSSLSPLLYHSLPADAPPFCKFFARFLQNLPKNTVSALDAAGGMVL
jgi:hypothetical protein